MKDIYKHMNTQNILKFYGTKLDIKLDNSEYYDYEIGKLDNDYNKDVLDLLTPITYTGLTINTNLSGLSCVKSTITISEDNVSDLISDYVYSGISFTLDYLKFVEYFGENYENTILDSNFYKFTLISGETHYFKIISYNSQKIINPPLDEYSEEEIISGFTNQVYTHRKQIIDGQSCSIQSPKTNAKPWAFNFSEGLGSDNCLPILKRRTEKGWTLDFIFNRENLPWNLGSTFYYIGVRGENDPFNYADNNLSFQFTSDRRIKWVKYHYSGYCGTNEYQEDFYVASGQTPQLCTIDGEKDFNITIVFDRYKRYTDCNLENDGGWNDMKGFRTNPYQDTEVTAVTSTQLSVLDENEVLSKKWADEQQRRLGILKIYLNGRPIYKLENWEEIIPSERGVQPFIQSWGGGTGLMNNIHSGVSCFNIKSIKYYEEPLDFVHVRHNFITRLNQYDFFICGEPCVESIVGFTPQPTPTITPTPNPTPIPVCPPELNSNCPTYFSRVFDNNLYFKNTGDTFNLISSYILGCPARQMVMDDSRLFFVDGCSTYNEYSYTITPEGCFNLTFVKDWEIWNNYPDTPNASSTLSFYDENTLIVGENQSSITQTGSTLYLYDLTTSNLTKWIELYGGAQVSNVYYNTGNTQMILTYTIANTNLGYYALYSGSTNPQLISQIPLGGDGGLTAGSALYFSGNTAISVAPSGVQYVLDFTTNTVSLIKKQNGAPILWIDYDEANTFAFIASVVNPASCYTFNIPFIEPTPTPTITPTPTETITPTPTPTPTPTINPSCDITYNIVPFDISCDITYNIVPFDMSCDVTYNII